MRIQIAIASLLTTIGLVGCTQFVPSLNSEGKSPMAGTWQGQMNCRLSADQRTQKIIWSFKESGVPGIASGEVYSLSKNLLGIEELVVITADATVTKDKKLFIDQKDVVVNPGGHWAPSDWEGTLTSEDSLTMDGCGTSMTLTRTSKDYTPNAWMLWSK